MRSFLAALLGLVALSVAAVAVPGIWVDLNLAQQEGFVVMTSPLGKDPAFQKALSVAIGQEVSNRIQAPGLLGEVIQPVITKAASSIMQDPDYPQAWTETLQRSHDLTVVDPKANANDSRVLNLDIAPLLQLVANKAGKELGQDLRVPQQVLVSLGSENQREAIVHMTDEAQAARWWGAAAVLAALLALVLARSRATALLLLAIGTAAVAGLWKLGFELFSAVELGPTGGQQVADLFKQEYLRIVSANINQWILMTLLIAAGMLLAGILGKTLSGRRSELYA